MIWISQLKAGMSLGGQKHVYACLSSYQELSRIRILAKSI